MDGVHVLLWVMIGIVILLAGYLSAIYIRIRVLFYKRKDPEMIESRSYPCYLNIILSSVIAIDNICRLITDIHSDALCTIQAFILAIFDKLILTTVTVNTYLTYCGLSDNEYYMNNIGRLFITANSISFGISLILAIIFVCNGTVQYNVCYVKGGDFKENIDTVVSFIIFCILYDIYFYIIGSYDLKTMLINIPKIFINYGTELGHLWYIYMIMGIYLFIPIISPWIKTAQKEHFYYYFAIWFISLFNVYIHYIYPEVW